MKLLIKTDSDIGIRLKSLDAKIRLKNGQIGKILNETHKGIINYKIDDYFLSGAIQQIYFEKEVKVCKKTFRQLSKVFNYYSINTKTEQGKILRLKLDQIGTIHISELNKILNIEEPLFVPVFNALYDKEKEEIEIDIMNYPFIRKYTLPVGIELIK